jgi:hypothetical protein
MSRWRSVLTRVGDYTLLQNTDDYREWDNDMTPCGDNTLQAPTAFPCFARLDGSDFSNHEFLYIEDACRLYNMLLICARRRNG